METCKRAMHYRFVSEKWIKILSERYSFYSVVIQTIPDQILIVQRPRARQDTLRYLD